MLLFRDINRLNRILFKSAKHYLIYLFQKILIPRKKGEIAARELRLLLEGLGPTFIKLGQLISVRPDLAPPDYIIELEDLQDDVAPMSYCFVEKQIEGELGKPVAEIFSKFEEKPLASASIGQVHKGVLRKENKPVAVKVMRPGIKKLIDADLSILKRIARHYQKRVSFVDLQGVIGEFEASLNREMDYLVEASHVKRFEKNFTDDKVVIIPRVFDKYTSSKILTLEFIEGWKLSELEVPESLGIDCFSLAKHGAEAFIRQVLEFSLFHGDLHPANILITPDDKIAYLDFGIVGEVPKEHRQTIASLLMAIIRQDAAEVVQQGKKIGVYISPGQIPAIKPELKVILDRYYGSTLGEIKIDIIGKEFLVLVYKHHIRIPTNYALLAKALITIEGVAKKIYPQINILEVAEPYVRKLLAEKLKTEKTKEELKRDLEQGLIKLIDIPKQVHDVLNQLRSGQLTVRQKQEDSEVVQKSILNAGIIIATSVFFAASFLGFIASLIADAKAWISYLTGTVSVFFFILASYRCYSAFRK